MALMLNITTGNDDKAYKKVRKLKDNKIKEF